ncbi:glycine cleavage system aminomethyltransferase GcvT [Marinibaculum pumilum]|uniref:aminomethyltransferase n=1 Tax=Marinibaculum pumilum TaxID=1766165 RepID=A0ABV7KW16_9PROT
MTAAESGGTAEAGGTLARTPFHALHLAHGARMVPFAGYEMPVQYRPGIIAEHKHCRTAAGLFDVSHMGQVVIDRDDAAAALEALVPGEIQALKPGRMRYTLFTNDAGGVLDDLMVTRRDDDLFLVVNAACKAADIAHLQAALGAASVRVLEDRALLALQGPEAAKVLDDLVPGVVGLPFMGGGRFALDGAELFVTRSGYTGEDGFEISLPADMAAGFAERLLAAEEVDWVGLGARDSLRLEAGLCLYGQDLDETTTPVEAGLTWAIGKRRRLEGGFPGAEVILQQLQEGPARRRVGLRIDGRAPARAGAGIVAADGDDSIGTVTSGGFAPSVGAPIAMGYVAAGQAASGSAVGLMVRGRRIEAKIADMPFVAHRYAR